MPELKSWFFKRAKTDGKFIAKGVVSGHRSPRCRDGSFIHTSHVQSVTDCGETLEIRTNNTLYTVRKSMVSTGVEMVEETEQALVAFLGEAGKQVNAQLRELREKRRSEVSTIKTVAASRLEKGQLFLALSSDKEYYFDYATYRNDFGDLIEEEIHIHVGTMQDSVLLANSDVRYFPYQQCSLEFYNSLYKMTKDRERVLPGNDVIMGYILNTGSAALKVQFTWGKTIEILPDRLVTVSRDNINWLADAELTSRADMYPAVMCNDVVVTGLNDESGSESPDDKE